MQKFFFYSLSDILSETMIHWRIQGGTVGTAPKDPDFFVLREILRNVAALEVDTTMGNPVSVTVRFRSNQG